MNKIINKKIILVNYKTNQKSNKDKCQLIFSKQAKFSKIVLNKKIKNNKSLT